MDHKVHKHLNEALEKWVKLTGVDPMSKKWNLHSWDVQRTYEQLEEAQKLDITGLTTSMLLRTFVEEWTLEATYSANDLLNKPKQVSDEVMKMREIIGILEHPEVKIPTDEFLNSLKTSVKHYKIVDKDTDSLLNNPFDIAYIRRDAMLAINQLASHQFMRGKTSDGPIKYSKNIYQFWNVNSLLRETARMPVSGVALCLIRDVVEEYHSYFAFAIRNGGNISLLTDKTAWVHPGQKNMDVRRPDKKFEQRAFQYHFPYNLLDIFIDQNDRIRIPKQKGLVRYNTEAIILGKMNQVPASSMIWLVMMLKLINDRYWHENDQAFLLSYTGEMAAFPKVLRDASSHLPILRSKKLTMPIITSNDIITDNLIKERQWEIKPTKKHEWMIERYGNKIPKNIFNLIDNGNLPLLPDKTNNDTSFFKRKKNPDRLTGLDPTEFGTRKTLVKDAKWHARYNQAMYISELAKKEFNHREKETLNWFMQKIRENKEALIRSIAAIKYETITQVRNSKYSFDHTHEVVKNILRIMWRPKLYPKIYPRDSTAWIGEHDSDGYRMCCLRNVKASIYGIFNPMVPEAVAKLTNCTFNDLPFGLKHYYANSPYHGNHGQSRVDPMEWAAENPWEDLNLCVVVCLSKRAFNNLRKELKLPPFTVDDWEKIKNEDPY